MAPSPCLALALGRLPTQFRAVWKQGWINLKCEADDTVRMQACKHTIVTSDRLRIVRDTKAYKRIAKTRWTARAGCKPQQLLVKKQPCTERSASERKKSVRRRSQRTLLAWH